jgi:hypothetical protein
LQERDAAISAILRADPRANPKVHATAIERNMKVKVWSSDGDEICCVNQKDLYKKYADRRVVSMAAIEQAVKRFLAKK